MAVSDSFPASRSASRRADRGPFVGAILALAVVAIAALDRAGAPEGFVRALGPALALVVSAGAGILARNADLPSFLAAGRSARPFFGGLALFALAAGLAACLYYADHATIDPPWQAVAAGLALGAFGVGPLLRRSGASWRSDVIASRFPAWPVRLVSGLAIFATAALTTYAGFRGATGIVESLAASSRTQAQAIVAATLILSAVPGGLASLVAAASAGAGALIAMLAAVIVLKGGFAAGVTPSPPDASPADLATLAAATLAVGVFFALDAPAMASQTPQVARLGALRALLLCVVLGAALFDLAPLSSGVEVSEVGLASLMGGAALAAFLAIACAGLHGSSRAFGVALNAPPRPFPVLASVRLARMRGAQILVTAGCAAADVYAPLEPRTALVAAMALTLALTAPLLALACLRRAGSIAAGAALAAAVAVIGYRWEGLLAPANAGALFETALAAAVVAFVLGAVVSLIAPQRRPTPSLPAFDPFADRSD
jgi:hypothetical protein